MISNIPSNNLDLFNCHGKYFVVKLCNSANISQSINFISVYNRAFDILKEILSKYLYKKKKKKFWKRRVHPPFSCCRMAIIVQVILMSINHIPCRQLLSDKPAKTNLHMKQKIKFHMSLRSLTLRCGEILSLFVHVTNLREKFQSWVNFQVILSEIPSIDNEIDVICLIISVDPLRKQLYVLGLFLLNIFAHSFLNIYIFIGTNVFYKRSILQPNYLTKIWLRAIANYSMNSLTINKLCTQEFSIIPNMLPNWCVCSFLSQTRLSFFRFNIVRFN